MTQEEPSQEKPSCEETAGAPEEGGLAADVLQAALDAANARADACRDDMLRARAELDNVQKRTQREIANAHKYALERFLGDLLPVKDSLELGRAAASEPSAAESSMTLREGMDLTLKLFDTTLEKHGVQAHAPLGEPFNPDRHQAIGMQESTEMAPGTVVTVVQKGYSLNDRLLRPAMVIVAKPPSEQQGEAGNGRGAA